MLICASDGASAGVSIAARRGHSNCLLVAWGLGELALEGLKVPDRRG
jgi:hypothetical protein